jgi:hypothetical protein
MRHTYMGQMIVITQQKIQLTSALIVQTAFRCELWFRPAIKIRLREAGGGLALEKKVPFDV